VDSKQDLVQAAAAAFGIGGAHAYTLSLWTDHKKNTEVRDKNPYELWLNVVSRSEGKIKFHLHRRRAPDSFALASTNTPQYIAMETWKRTHLSLRCFDFWISC